MSVVPAVDKSRRSGIQGVVTGARSAQHLSAVTRCSGNKHYNRQTQFNDRGLACTVTSARPDMTSQTILILWTLSSMFFAGASDDCRRSWLDLVFVLDSSASVDAAEFAAMKNFVASIVRQLHVSMETNRLALVRFSTEVDVIAYFNQSTSSAQFIDALYNMSYEDGSTNTDLALEKVGDEVLAESAGDRPGVGDVIVVISEGQSSEPDLTLTVANQLRARGAQVVGLAIGSSSDLLTDMAAFTAGHFRTAKSFDGLKDVLTMFTQFLCSASTNAITEARQRHPPSSHPSSPPPPLPPASKVATSEKSVKTSSTTRVPASTWPLSETTLLASGTTGTSSVSASRQSSATSTITPALSSAASTAVNPQTTTSERVATETLTTYAADALTSRIDDALTTHTANAEKMITIDGGAADTTYARMEITDKVVPSITPVDELSQHTSASEELTMHKPTIDELAALINASDAMTSNTMSAEVQNAQARISVPSSSQAVLPSGGSSAVPSVMTETPVAQTSQFPAGSTDPQAVEVSIVWSSAEWTPSKATQRTAASAVTSPPLASQMLSSTMDMVTQPGTAASETTSSPPSVTSSKTSCSQTWVDLVFALDSSSSMYNYEFDVIKQFVADVLKQLSVSMVTDRVALVRFSSEVNVIAYLNQSVSNRQLLDRLTSMQYSPGGTNTKKALNVTRRQVLSETSGNRPDVADVVVVITDGKSWDPRGSQLEADLLRQQGAQVIGLAIGTKKDMDEDVKNFTAGQYHQVDNFRNVTSIINSFRKLMCYATQKAAQSLKERLWRISSASSAVTKTSRLPSTPQPTISSTSSVTAPKTKAGNSTVTTARAVSSRSSLLSMTAIMSFDESSMRSDVTKGPLASDLSTSADGTTAAAASTTSNDVTTTRHSLEVSVTAQENHTVTAQDNQANHSVTTQANQANYSVTAHTDQANYSVTAQANQVNHSVTVHASQANHSVTTQASQANYSVTAHTNQANYSVTAQANQANYSVTAHTNQANYSVTVQANQANYSVTAHTNQANYSVTAQANQVIHSVTAHANQANHSVTAHTSQANHTNPTAEDSTYEVGEILEGSVSEDGSWWENEWLTVPAMTGGGIVLVGLTSGLLHYAVIRRCKQGKKRTPNTEL